MLFFRQLNWNFFWKKSRGTSLILPTTYVILTFTEMPRVPNEKDKIITLPNTADETMSQKS